MPSLLAIVAALALIISVLFNISYLNYVAPKAAFSMTLQDHISLTTFVFLFIMKGVVFALVVADLAIIVLHWHYWKDLAVILKWLT
jgi:hypothetical protein